MDDLSKNVKSTFKLNGYNLNVETSKYIVEVLTGIKPDQRDSYTEKIIDELAKRNIESSSALNKNVIADVVKELNFTVKDSKDKIFFVIDSFQVPKYNYCEERRRFFKDDSEVKSVDSECTKPIIGEAMDKINIFFQRYAIMYQRTVRHELFSPITIGSYSDSSKKKFQLKPIEHLLSHTTSAGETIILGMLSQLKENKFYLEDPTGSLPLDLTETKYHSGIYTEGSFVLAEGRYDDGTFFVRAIGFPPPEVETITRSYFGNLNFFGGPSDTNCKAVQSLKQIESSFESMIIFLSDVWLDCPKIYEKLHVLFSGYSDTPPYAFVLCGNFLSVSKYGLRCNDLTEGFKKLADLICQFSSIKDFSHFIFIPGPQDSRPSYKNNHLPGTFAPLPLHVVPLYWNYDYAMRLYPLPDLVVIADSKQSFTQTYSECTVMNPGSFPSNNFAFKVYVPSSNTLEDCQLPN